MPSKRRKHSRQRKRQAQKKAAAQAAGQGGTPVAPPAVTPVQNGTAAPVAVPTPVPSQPQQIKSSPSVQVKVEDTKSSPAVTTANQMHVTNPLDTLANSLPPSEPHVSPNFSYMDNMFQKSGITSEKAVLCGERDSTLPPGYRFENMNKNVPEGKIEAKKEEVPTKPLSTDGALDALSAGFTSSAVPCVEAKNDFSLEATLNSAQPPADKKTRMEEEASVPLDALSALSDTLGALEPEPEPPKVQPEHIVTEAELTSEAGVRVGEREDTLPPEYRFTEENGTDLPPPKEQDKPPMDDTAALDILSGDFSSPSAVHTSVITPTAPANQSSTEVLDMLAGDFDAPAVVPDVQSAIEPTLPVDDIVTEENEAHVKPKKSSMDDSSAFDVVSCDFGSSAVPPSVKPLGEDASDLVPAQS